MQINNIVLFIFNTVKILIYKGLYHQLWWLTSLRHCVVALKCYEGSQVLGLNPARDIYILNGWIKFLLDRVRLKTPIKTSSKKIECHSQPSLLFCLFTCDKHHSAKGQALNIQIPNQSGNLIPTVPSLKNMIWQNLSP